MQPEEGLCGPVVRKFHARHLVKRLLRDSFHTQMQLEPRDSTLTRPATGPLTGRLWEQLPAPGRSSSHPILVLGAPSTGVSQAGVPAFPAPTPTSREQAI